MNLTNELLKIKTDNNVDIVYVSLVGSKLYGTHNKNSDTDIRFIFIPKIEDIILQKSKNNIRVTSQTKTKNTKDDVDFDGWSLQYFIRLLEKGDTNAFDLLFSMFQCDTIIYENKEFTQEIRQNYTKLLNRNIKGFVGYCLAQVRKFGIKGERYTDLQKLIDKLRVIDNMSNIFDDCKLGDKWEILKAYTQKENFQHIKFIEAPGPNNETWEYFSVLGKLFHKNVKFKYFFDKVLELEKQFGNRTKSTAKTESKKDPKSTYHALRVALELKELLSTGFIEFPLKNANELKEIKEGNFNFEDVQEKIENIIQETDELLLKSSLPEKSDGEFISSLILKMITKVEADEKNEK